MFHTLLSQVTTLAMVCVGAWALLGGRWPERVTALAYMFNWLGTALWQDRRPNHHGQPVIMVLDGAFLLLLLLLTVSCRRTWVLWMAACSLLVVFTNVLGALDPSFGQWTYVTAYYVWSLGALVSFAIGVAVEGRRPVVQLVRFA